MKDKECSQCDYVGKLWKASPRLCKPCAIRHNTTNKVKVAQKPPIAVKHYVISKVSSKQSKINQAYTVLRKQFLKDKPFCEVCGDISSQVHHKIGRIAHRTLDTSEWLSVCFTCHEQIETNVAWAKEHGYSKDRL